MYPSRCYTRGLLGPHDFNSTNDIGDGRRHHKTNKYNP